MKFTKEQRGGLKTMIITLLIVLVVAYLFIKIVFATQLIMTPCELCSEGKPYLKSCIQQAENTHYTIGDFNLSSISGKEV